MSQLILTRIHTVKSVVILKAIFFILNSQALGKLKMCRTTLQRYLNVSILG